MPPVVHRQRPPSVVEIREGDGDDELAAVEPSSTSLSDQCVGDLGAELKGVPGIRSRKVIAQRDGRLALLHIVVDDLHRAVPQQPVQRVVDAHERRIARHDVIHWKVVLGAVEDVLGSADAVAVCAQHISIGTAASGPMRGVSRAWPMVLDYSWSRATGTQEAHRG